MDVDAGTGLEGHKLEFVYILEKTYSIFEIP